MQIEQLGNLFKDFPNRLLISLVFFAISLMLMFDVLSGVLLEEEGESKDETNKEANQVDSADDSDFAQSHNPDC